MWTKRQRIEAIVKGEPADRPPVSAWKHFIGHELGSANLANAVVEFQKKYDWDFVKINPRAVYYHEAWGNKYDYSNYKDVVPTRISQILNKVDDLAEINELTGQEPPFAEQLEAVKLIRRDLGNEVPLFQTIFTPIGVLLNLCGGRSVGRYRTSPREESLLIKILLQDSAGAHRALKAIANTLAKYAEATLKAGADGVFYAALGMAREGYLTLTEWREFVRPYDLIVLEALKQAPVILHTCGIYGNPQRFVDYPIEVLHWAESAPGNPTIASSSGWIGEKAVMGGVDERFFGTGAVAEIAAQAKGALKMHAGRAFALAPECSVAPGTSDEEFRTLREIVEAK